MVPSSNTGSDINANDEAFPGIFDLTVNELII